LFEGWPTILVIAKKNEAFEPYKQKRLAKKNTKQKHKNRKQKNSQK
jgi:hypothetical protein